MKELKDKKTLSLIVAGLGLTVAVLNWDEKKMTKEEIVKTNGSLGLKTLGLIIAIGGTISFLTSK